MAKNVLSVNIDLNSKGYAKGARDVVNYNRKMQREVEAVNKKFTSFAKGIGGIGAAFLGVQSASAVFQRAIGSCQATTDEFARITESTNAVITSFFSSMLNADFSGFISGLSQVISTARELADAIDQLETHQIFSTPEVERIKLNIEKARNILRDSSKKNMWAQAREDLKKYEQQLIAVNKRLAEDNRNAYRKSVNNIINSGGARMSEAQIKNFEKQYPMTMAGQDKAEAEFKKMQEIINKGSQVDIQGYRHISKEASEIMKSDKYRYLRARANNNNDESLRKAFSYDVAATRSEAEVERIKGGDIRLSNKVDKVTTPKAAKQPKTQTKKTKTIAPSVSAKIEAEKEELELEKKGWTDLHKDAVADFRSMLDTGGEAGWNTEFLSKNMEKMLENNRILKEQLAEINAFTFDSIISAFQELGNAIGGTSGKVLALGATIAAQLAEGTMQTLQVIAQQQAMAQAKGVASAAELPFPANIAAIASVVATIASIFSTIAGSFEEGGVVGGNSYHGDRLLARVNSGEVILNKRQVGNLYNALQGGGAAGAVRFRISGSDLVGTLNNYSRQMNRL